MFGSVGAIVDMNSESWLLKGILLACVIGVVNVASRWGPIFTELFSWLKFKCRRRSFKPHILLHMPIIKTGCLSFNKKCLFLNRNFPSPAFQSLLPSTSLMASIFWMLVTWCLWFLPDILNTLKQLQNSCVLCSLYVRACVVVGCVFLSPLEDCSDRYLQEFINVQRKKIRSVDQGESVKAAWHWRKRLREQFRHS